MPDGHKCGRMHGHTYRVRLEVSGKIGGETGWVIDYADLKAVWDIVKRGLDHVELNDVPGLGNPTCEYIALFIRDTIKPHVPGLSRVILRETEHCGVMLDC